MMVLVAKGMAIIAVRQFFRILAASAWASTPHPAVLLERPLSGLERASASQLPARAHASLEAGLEGWIH